MNPDPPLPAPLTVDEVYRRCPLAPLTFETTDELPALEMPFGQDRATQALEFGTGIANHGFNIYVLGHARSDRLGLVRQFLERARIHRNTPPDWCLVFNFVNPDEPRALRLPAGEGRKLRRDFERLIEELTSAIPATFDSDEYQARLQELQQEIASRQQGGISEIGKEAAERDIALISTPSGFTLLPSRDGEALDPEEYAKLDDDKREEIESTIAELQQKLQQHVQQMPRLRKQFQEKVRALNEEMVLFALGAPIRELKDEWSHLPAVCQQLDAIREDVITHAEAFRADGRRSGPPAQLLERYRINLLIDNADIDGAPVIYEDLPNHQRLTGQIEHQVSQGALVTSFMLVRGGALHRANGGFLIIDARRVLSQPAAWDSLKRVLASGEIRIESLERLYGLVSTVSLQPEPIPVRLKVVLIGDRLLYYLLSRYDPDFLELFKVQADFEDELPRSDDDLRLYARMMATMARHGGLRPLKREAVARMIEEASRMAADQAKLTAHDRDLRDLMMEADYWAASSARRRIGCEHIEQAIAERERRANRIEQIGLERIERGMVLISVTGEAVAQVNGLSVLQIGARRFGRPSRITATARPGKDQVVDIEREAKLGGPIHSKGVMILSRFIASRYAPEQELSLTASLAFEQSYGGVEGDSASVAEALALLSAIARVPLKQHLAVTGSLNQLGEVQAVGGVNEKIEGFFAVCQQNGEVDGQGVLLPASNVDQLMLKAEVREAIAEGRFSIYPIRHIDQAIALMTGLDAGQPDDRGHFPPETFNGKVAARLTRFARITRKSTASSRKKASKKD